MLGHSVVSDSLWPHGLWPTRLLCPWGFARQEYWSGLPCLLQGIFPTQGLNPGLLHCRWILYHLSHQESPVYNRICMYDVCIHILYIYYTHIIHTHSIYTYPIGSFSLEISNINIIILFYKWNWGIKIPQLITVIPQNSFFSFKIGTHHWYLYDVPFPLLFIFGREGKKGDVNEGMLIEKRTESRGGWQRADSADSHEASSLFPKGIIVISLAP